ncbi:MAG: hypothetical protein WC223_10850 [Bacteroidales bacterium]|jgi:hypothetical protein
MAHSNKILFSKPDRAGMVKVSRFLSDGSIEQLGQINSALSDNDEITYVATNEQGEEIAFPTSDFTEIEMNFSRYAKELSEKSQYENLEIKAEELISRERSINSIRLNKIKNLELLKSF